MRSKELMAYNLPNSSLIVADIDAKPNSFFFILSMVGVISVISSEPNYYNIALIVLPLCAMCFMPKVVLMEFFPSFLVMYNRVDRNKCMIIYYDEVVSWYYSWGANKDYLVIELTDGTSQKIEAFSKTLFEYRMNQFLKNKHRKGK